MGRSGPSDAAAAAAVLAYQATGDEAGLAVVWRWAEPRITAAARRVAREWDVDAADLEAVGPGVVLDTVRRFNPRARGGYGPYFQRSLAHAVAAAARPRSGFAGETAHTRRDRAAVLAAHAAVYREEPAARRVALRQPAPDPLALPPLDAAFRAAVRAGSDPARRHAFYATIPGVLGAVGAYLRNALPAADAGVIVALAGACVTGAVEAGAAVAVRGDVLSDAPADALPPAPSLERALRAAVADARSRYLVWGALAVSHPHREFWAEVGRRAGVSARQARLLYDTRRAMVSLDAAVPGRSELGRPRTLGDRPAAPAPSLAACAFAAAVGDGAPLGGGSTIDDGPAADDPDAANAAERDGRRWAAEAAYARLRWPVQQALVTAYHLRAPEGAGRRLAAAGDPRFLGPVVGMRGDLRMRAAGERALGRHLWVLVAASGAPRRVWRRHPALCAVRRVRMLVRAWTRRVHRGVGDAAAPEVIGPTGVIPAHVLARALRRAGMGALGRGRTGLRPVRGAAMATLWAAPAGAPATVSRVTVLRVEHPAAGVVVDTRLEPSPLTRAVTRDAHPVDVSGPGGAGTDPRNQAGGYAAGAWNAGPPASGISAPSGFAPSGSTPGQVSTVGGGTRPDPAPDDAVLGRASARALAAVARAVAGDTLLHIRGGTTGHGGFTVQGGDRTWSVDGRPPAGLRRRPPRRPTVVVGAAVRHGPAHGPPSHAGAGAPAAPGTPDPVDTAPGPVRLRAAALIRAALRVAAPNARGRPPVRAGAPDQARAAGVGVTLWPSQAGWARGSATLAVADGAVAVAVLRRMVGAFYDAFDVRRASHVPAVRPGVPEPPDPVPAGAVQWGAPAAGAGPESGWLAARVPGRLIASLAEVFRPNDVLEVSVRGGLLVLAGTETVVRVPYVPVQTPPALSARFTRVTNGRPLGRVDARAHARAVWDAAGAQWRAQGRVGPVWVDPLAGIASEDVPEPAAPVPVRWEVLAASYWSALAAMPGSLADLEFGTYALGDGASTPVLVLRAHSPGPTPGTGGAGVAERTWFVVFARERPPS